MYKATKEAPKQAEGPESKRPGTKVPSTDRISNPLATEEREGIISITRPDRASMSDVFSRLNGKFCENGFECSWRDIEMEWGYDIEGDNRDLVSGFDVKKCGEHVAAVEIRDARKECDIVWVMFASSTKTDPARAQKVRAVVDEAVSEFSSSASS